MSRYNEVQMTHFVGDDCIPDGHREEMEGYEKRTLSSPLSPDCEVSSAPTVSTPQSDSTTPKEETQVVTTNCFGEVDCNFCPASAEATYGGLFLCQFCLDLIEVKGLGYGEIAEYWDDERYEEYPN